MQGLYIHTIPKNILARQAVTPTVKRKKRNHALADISALFSNLEDVAYATARQELLSWLEAVFCSEADGSKAQDGDKMTLGFTLSDGTV